MKKIINKILAIRQNIDSMGAYIEPTGRWKLVFNGCDSLFIEHITPYGKMWVSENDIEFIEVFDEFVFDPNEN